MSKKPDREAKEEVAAGVPDAVAGAPPVVEPAAEALRVKLAETEEKLRSIEDRLLRWHAEADNRRKREAAERPYAQRGLLLDLLPVAEALDLAAFHAAEGANAASIAEGVRLTDEMLHAVLARHGVVEIESVGKPFDPDLHECVAFVDAEAGKEGIVVDELRKGYRLHDRVLCPSQVRVGRRAGTRENHSECGEERKSDGQDDRD